MSRDPIRRVGRFPAMLRTVLRAVLPLLVLLAAPAEHALAQKASDLEYPLEQLFAYPLTFSDPTGRARADSIDLRSAFFVRGSSGGMSCPSSYDTNFSVDSTTGLLSIYDSDDVPSGDNYYYCYTPAGSSPYRVNFNRAATRAVSYTRKAVSTSGTSTLPSSITGYASQRQALANIQEYGALRLDHQVTVSGYYALHASSLTFLNGGGISVTDGALLIITDGGVTADLDNNCPRHQWECDSNNNNPLRISNTYILAGGDVSFKVGWSEPRGRRTYYDFGLEMEKVKISAPSIKVFAKFLIGHYIEEKDDPQLYYYLAASKISFPSSDLWDFASAVQDESFVVDTSGITPSCQQGWVSVTSQSGSVESVTLKITGDGYFLKDGERSQEIQADSDGSRIPVVPGSAAEGALTVSLEGGSYECTSGCGVDFRPSALMFLPGTDLGETFASGGTAVYAGKGFASNLAVVHSTGEDLSICETGSLADAKAVLSLVYNTAVRTKSSFAAGDGAAVASEGGVELALAMNGSVYRIPEFYYGDAGSVTLKAVGHATAAEGDPGEPVALEGELTLKYAPYAVVPSVDASCGDDTECAAVASLSGSEKYLAGQDLKITYLPKAWCSGGEGGDYSSCATVLSYGYDSGFQNTIEPVAENLQDTGETKGNYLAPGLVTLDQKNDNGALIAGGGTERTSAISDVGNYAIRIPAFTDALSGLEIHETTLTLDGLVAPYYFEIGQYSSSVNPVPNSCPAADADSQLSFTYFGQPVAPRIVLTAKNRTGDRTAFFDQSHYPQETLAEYSLVPDIMTSSGGTYAPLYGTGDGGVKFRRIVTCDRCSNALLSESWSGGRIYLNATSDDLLLTGDASAASAPFYYRILPAGYQSTTEGAEKILDYRSESPRLSGSSWSRFYVFPALALQEASGSGSVRRDLRLAEGVSGEKMTYTDLLGSSVAAVVFKDSPLEMRTGRIALLSARAAPKNDLYMPVQFEYYRRVAGSGDSDVAAGWVRNTDDNCTVLSRDSFYVEPFGQSSEASYLKKITSGSVAVTYGNGVKSRTAGLVNVNDGSVSPGETATSRNGRMYLMLSSPEGDADLHSPLFLLRDFTPGINFTGTVPDADNVTPVRDSVGTDPMVSGPFWLGTTLEGVDQAFGAFRAWPGTDRVIYRLEQ